MYHTPKGIFVSGWIYKNGTLTASLITSQHTATQTSIKNNQPAVQSVINEIIEVCTDYYTVVTVNGVSYPPEYTSTSCTFYDDSSGDGGDGGTGTGSGGTGGTGGSGGTGSGTPPAAPPCSVPSGAVIKNTTVAGRFISDTVQPGSPGGSTGFPPPTSAPCVTIIASQQITNNLKNPCAKQVLDDLINDDLTGQIANIIQNLFGSTTQVNLDFEESTTTQGNAPTASSPPVVANGIFNDKITLNSSQIAGSSKEYLASIMIHEVLHAYLSYNGVAQNQLLQHQNIALNYVSGIRDLLQQEYDISSEDANCLIIEGLSDLQSNPLYSNFYNNLLSSLNLTTGLIQTTSLLYKEGINGTSCGN